MHAKIRPGINNSLKYMLDNILCISPPTTYNMHEPATTGIWKQLYN